MSIRIKELNIKTTVNDNSSEKSNNNQQNMGLSPSELNNIKIWIIEECLEEVKQLLERKQQK